MRRSATSANGASTADFAVQKAVMTLTSGAVVIAWLQGPKEGREDDGEKLDVLMWSSSRLKLQGKQTRFQAAANVRRAAKTLGPSIPDVTKK